MKFNDVNYMNNSNDILSNIYIYIYIKEFNTYLH